MVNAGYGIVTYPDKIAYGFALWVPYSARFCQYLGSHAHISQQTNSTRRLASNTPCAYAWAEAGLAKGFCPDLQFNASNQPSCMFLCISVSLNISATSAVKNSNGYGGCRIMTSG